MTHFKELTGKIKACTNIGNLDTYIHGKYYYYKDETKAFPNKSWENSCCATRNGKVSPSDLQKMNTEKNHEGQ